MADLVTKINDIYKYRVQPYFEGLISPLMVATSGRRYRRKFSQAQLADREEGTIKYEGTPRSGPFGRKSIAYVFSYNLGFITSTVATIQVSFGPGMYQLEDNQDPAILVTTLSALVIGNLVSLLYEGKRNKQDMKLH